MRLLVLTHGQVSALEGALVSKLYILNLWSRVEAPRGIYI